MLRLLFLLWQVGKEVETVLHWLNDKEIELQRYVIVIAIVPLLLTTYVRPVSLC